MGRWGPLLFQGDDDLDVIDGLCAKYGIDLNCYGESPPQEGEAEADRAGSMTLEQARSKLDDGLLMRVFSDFKTQSNHDLYSLFMFCGKAMEIGAHFSEEQMALLRSRLPVIHDKELIHDEGMEQFKKALDSYANDGTPYDFESPGLLETMQTGSWMRKDPNAPDTTDAGSDGPSGGGGKPKGFQLMNWLPPPRHSTNNQPSQEAPRNVNEMNDNDILDGCLRLAAKRWLDSM